MHLPGALTSIESSRLDALESVLRIALDARKDFGDWLHFVNNGPAGQRAPAHSRAGCAGHRPFFAPLGLGMRTITITAGGESRSHTTVSIVSRVSNDGLAAA